MTQTQADEFYYTLSDRLAVIGGWDSVCNTYIRSHRKRVAEIIIEAVADYHEELLDASGGGDDGTK